MLKSGYLPRLRAGQLQSGLLSMLADYATLTKPPIVLLLLITAVGAMFLAAEGAPPLMATIFLMLGGAAAAGGASAINHYLDRDIDALMSRTSKRPIPARRVSPGAALGFGIVLNVFAFTLLATKVNLLAASLTLTGTLFYVFVYTWWLKRSTPQNIVIGGAAGAVPPLAGWAAVTGGLDISAFLLFAIVFLWTPPHFWALALIIREDYARAGVPMLPVVAGVETTRRSILLYTVLVVALSILLAVTGAMGWFYIFAAGALGAVFLALAWRVVTRNSKGDHSGGLKRERTLYLYSLLYLAALFVAVMLDSMIS